MPNGGFGCAYCVFYTKSFCNLRKVRITTDHWTVCANITYPEGGPLASDTFTQISGIPVGSSDIKGSVFAITGDEGAYIQVPWLEDGEIHVVNSMRTCVICQKSQTQGKGILFRGNKYFFCSYAHYLSWRNKQIADYGIDEEPTSEGALQRFYDYRDLRVIRENTTEEQRNRANELDAEGDATNLILKAVIGLGVAIAVLMLFFIFFK